MRKSVLLLISIVLSGLCITSYGQNKDRRKSFKSWDNYEIVTEKVGTAGTKFVKVWGFGKNVDAAVMQAKKNAVHACLFRGLPASSSAMATPPICPSPGSFENNLEFFEEFFAPGGAYLSYVNVTTDGMPAGQDRLKVKKGWKVGVYVQVMYDNLKARMQSEGLAKSLSSGF